MDKNGPKKRHREEGRERGTEATPRREAGSLRVTWPDTTDGSRDMHHRRQDSGQDRQQDTPHRRPDRREDRATGVCAAPSATRATTTGFNTT